MASCREAYRDFGARELRAAHSTAQLLPSRCECDTERVPLVARSASGHQLHVRPPLPAQLDADRWVIGERRACRVDEATVRPPSEDVDVDMPRAADHEYFKPYEPIG